MVRQPDSSQDIPLERLDERREEIKSLGVNIGYAINLNLPETTNVAVYDAIFRSLKEHLFRK